MGIACRTDLALEVREQFPEDDVEISGVVLKESYNKQKDIKITRVEIRDERGARAMQRPMGIYITVESGKLTDQEEGFRREICAEIATQLRGLLKDAAKEGVLVAGLGNRDITPDAVGPGVIARLLVTRHLIREFGEEFGQRNRLSCVSAIAPGVMAQTGMESAELLRGIIKELSVGTVILVDCLAAGNISRLHTTVQLTDAGICPGAGVGNDRACINEKVLGVPVICIGVPTVVDAITITHEAVERVLRRQGFGEKEVNAFLEGIRDESLAKLFVTPKDTDEAVRELSKILAEAINMALER